jgi:hypothetical protein
MRAKLGSFVGVEAALEQGAHDRGVDVGPIEVGGAFEVINVGIGEGEGVIGVEEAAVEPFDPVKADASPIAHGGEQLGGEACEQVIVAARAAFDHLGEVLVGQKAGIFGEHAEDEAVDEMGDGLGIMAALAQAVGDGGEFPGGILGQRLAGKVGFEAGGVEEAVAEEVALFGEEEVGQGNVVDLGDGVGEVGVNLDPVGVGDDEKRGRAEGLGIAEKLGKGGFQVLALALVFPAEAILAPDIGPAFTAGSFGDATLEGEPFAFGVGGDGRGDVEEVAEVVEMGLGGGAFLELHLPPFVDEILGGHGVPLPASCS